MDPGRKQGCHVDKEGSLVPPTCLYTLGDGPGTQTPYPSPRGRDRWPEHADARVLEPGCPGLTPGDLLEAKA